MLSKCAHPDCDAAFLYLHEGRVFRLELNHPAVLRKYASRRSFEYFWLCVECMDHWTVVFEDQTVKVHPLRVPATAGAVPAMTESKVA